VATAGLSAPDIAAPIRQILAKQDNTTVLLGEVTAIDADKREIVVDGSSILSYDYLVVAAGAVNHWFGHDDWERHAPGLKSLGDALEIRRRILLAYEAAEREQDDERRKPWLCFVVIGAGPTGVELAGSIVDIARTTLARNFRSFSSSETRVILLEGSERVLPPYPPALSARAREQLEDIGVEVHTSARVTDISEAGVTLEDGTSIEARTVLWGAGVKASPLLQTIKAEHDRGGRIKVSADLSVPGHPEVFVVGDAAWVTQADGSAVPGVAPAAMQMGTYAAGVIINRQLGKTVSPFRYKDKGSLATIGRKKAVADFGRVTFSGLSAWLLWMAVHLLFLIGFRNRLAVVMEWAYAYLAYQRSARVILSSNEALPYITEDDPLKALEEVEAAEVLPS
ncbi:MAG: NADH dehydrogenase, partial [Myxococcota bacterium]